MISQFYGWIKAPGGFFWKWVLASALAFLLTNVLSQYRGNSAGWTLSTDTIIVLVILQWTILHQRQPSISLWWVFGPIVGQFILNLGLLMGWSPLIINVNSIGSMRTWFAFQGIIIGLVVGASQWWSLRRLPLCRYPILWMGINALAFGLAYSATYAFATDYKLSSLGLFYWPFGSILFPVLVGLGVGLITGIGIIRIVRLDNSTNQDSKLMTKTTGSL